MNKLTSFLQEALQSYSDNSAGKTPAEWLKDYLGENLTSKTQEKIADYSGEVIESVDFMEQKQAEMNAAAEAGMAGLREIRSEMFAKAANEGIEALTDKG